MYVNLPNSDDPTRTLNFGIPTYNKAQGKEERKNTMHFLLTPPIRSARHSNGFLTPPLDGSLTISELYDFHLEHNPTHPVFTYVNEANNLVRLSFSEVVPAAHNAARLVARRANIDLEGLKSVTIAILATTGSHNLTFFCVR